MTTGDRVRITDQMPTAQSTSLVQKPCCSLDEFFAVFVVTTRALRVFFAEIFLAEMLMRAGFDQLANA